MISIEKSHCRHELYTLTFCEFWDRFSYYGIQALLVLYVTKIFLFTDTQAYALYGTFTALTFATPVLGGILADKIVGPLPCITLGGILLIIANIFLILPNKMCMYVGLSALICGIGLFKPNNANLVGILHKKPEVQQQAFSIFYMGMNAGALLAPLIYGYLAHCYGWHYGFEITAIGATLSFILWYRIKIILAKETIPLTYQANPHNFLPLSTNKIVILSIIVAASLICFFLEHSEWFGDLLIFVGLAAITGLISIAVKNNISDRKKIIGLSFLSFFCIFFFASSLQTATTLTLFIERDINRTIGDIHIPTMMFLSLEPFFIIITAPWLSRLWALIGEPSFSIKMVIGLLLAGLSFFIFSLAAYYDNAHEHMALIFIIIGNLSLGLGELCVLPVALSAISLLAPANIRSTMIGILFLSLSFSGYLAGAIANLISTQNLAGSLHSVVNYTQAFIDVALVTIAVSAVMLFMNPLLKWLLQMETNNQ